MSFLSKWKSSTSPAGQAAGVSSTKKDPNAPQPTLLEQRLADATGPVRTDGSDKFFGFENYGSTCYCNSIIQCLYYSAPFRENVLNFPSQSFLEDLRTQHPNGKPLPPSTPSVSPYPNLTSPARKPAAPTSPGGIARPEDSKDSPEYKKRQALTVGPVLDMTQDNSVKYGMGESLFTSLRDIFEAIIGNQSRIGVVSPHRFLEILRRENEMFRSAMHQDAHEFLNLLLNQVMDNVENFSKQYPSALMPPVMNGSLAGSTNASDLQSSSSEAHWVHDLFEGQLTSETRCLTCENTSQRDEAFLDLSVDLSAHTSVTSCLRKFSEEEMLCERNKFHCDNCGGLQEAEKRMKIKRLPRILALHLKRFKYTEDLQRLQKLFHRVVYPFYLRLFNTTDDAEDPDRLYELYAVVVHIGGGPYHGHYVSIIKTQDRGWLLFDDEMVEPVDQSYVLNFFGGEPVPGLQDAKQLACAYVLFYQETTLEAMLRAQAADGGTASASAPVRVSDAETAKDGPGSPLYHTNTNTMTTTTTTEDVPPFEHLAHAATAPQISVHAPARPHLDHLATTLGSPLSASPPPQTSIPAPKSKKELKQEEKERKAEEKERKAEEKARQKAEERAAAEKARTSVTNRLEAWRRADEEMRQVVEHSRVTAEEEARMRASSNDEHGTSTTATASTAPTPAASEYSGEAPALHHQHIAGIKQKESGLARFRHGSMSLRSKPRLFSLSKDKDKGLATTSTSTATATATATTAPGTNGAAANGTNGVARSASGKQAGASSFSPTPPPPPPAPPRVSTTALPQAPPPPEKKSRFSLGRKKSTALS